MKVRTEDQKNTSCPIVQETSNLTDKGERVMVNCYKCSKPISFSKKDFENLDPEKIICKQCRKLEIKGRTYITCKTCGKKFYIKKEKVDFLNSLGYVLPARCFSCNQIKKNKHKK